MIASHNTMTYLEPSRWYMKPFAFIAKCQSKNIVEQYNAGARFFDLRIGFDKEGRPRFQHGLVSYKGSVGDVLDYLSSKEDIIIRIISEDNSPFFISFCASIEATYGSIFCGGERKSDWQLVYKFKHNPSYTMKECYSSMPGNNILWSIWPRLYSYLHKNILTEGYIEDFLMIDFI